jgi:hypothetical protein
MWQLRGRGRGKGPVEARPLQSVIYVAAAPEALAHRRGRPTGAPVLRLAVGGLFHPSRGTLPANWVMRMLAALACLPPSPTVGVGAAPETAFG